jgi:hypothetical protein
MQALWTVDDPVETFDIDLSDYQDEYVKILAEDYAYQDE